MDLISLRLNVRGFSTAISPGSQRCAKIAGLVRPLVEAPAMSAPVIAPNSFWTHPVRLLISRASLGSN
jgi:hypothetical protein